MIKTRIKVEKKKEKQVEKYGAKYDGRMKSWYIPESCNILDFTKFIPLTIELIPYSSWEKNVRSERKTEWDKLRKLTYLLANNTCEICGADNEVMESHESWEFDKEKKVQKLISLKCLCHKCHRTKHYGLACINNEEKMVQKHILNINKWKMNDLQKYLNEIYQEYDELSQIDWALDLSYLDDVKY